MVQVVQKIMNKMVLYKLKFSQTPPDEMRGAQKNRLFSNPWKFSARNFQQLKNPPAYPYR